MWGDNQISSNNQISTIRHRLGCLGKLNLHALEKPQFFPKDEQTHLTARSETIIPFRMTDLSQLQRCTMLSLGAFWGVVIYLTSPDFLLLTY
jgi:hypothetical protein